jgi:hypothetical protein
LTLTQFGATLPATPLGGGRFSFRPPGAPQAEVFRVVPPEAGRRGFVQMFLWAFPRVERERATGAAR